MVLSHFPLLAGVPHRGGILTGLPFPGDCTGARDPAILHLHSLVLSGGWDRWAGWRLTRRQRVGGRWRPGRGRVRRRPRGVEQGRTCRGTEVTREGLRHLMRVVRWQRGGGGGGGGGGWWRRSSLYHIVSWDWFRLNSWRLLLLHLRPHLPEAGQLRPVRGGETRGRLAGGVAGLPAL